MADVVKNLVRLVRGPHKSPYPGTRGSVLSVAPIPPQDVARAAELARERGWKDRPYA